MNLSGSAFLLTSALFAVSSCFAAAVTNRVDQQFAFKAAEGALAEQQMGQYAQQKSHNPQLKQFAQRMVKDHQSEYQQLSSMAGTLGLKIPSALTGVRQAEVQKFEHVNANNQQQFDKLFLNWVKEDHQKAINLFGQEARSGRNPDLMGFAHGMLPDLQDHLNTANRLSSNGALSASNQMPNSANRMAQNGREYQATVISYQANKSLEVKGKGRIGRHVYDLSKTPANVSGNLQAGTVVNITENTNANGQTSLTVQPVNRH